NREAVAAHELHGQATWQPPGADLRPAQVLEDGERAFQPLARPANAREARRVLVVRSVREVESEDVDARARQGEDAFVSRARRPESGDDPGLSHARLSIQSPL